MAEKCDIGDSASLSQPHFSKKLGYTNPWSTWKEKTVGQLMTWLLRSRSASLPSRDVLDSSLPVLTPNFGEETPGDGVKATWLGHATVLFQLDGVRVLCDPVFGERCSAVSFAGPKRARPVPCQISELPEVHAIVISHNHYDHLDYHSCVQLGRRFPSAQWFVPAGLGGWMTSTLGGDGGGIRVTELSWWEEGTLPGGVRVAATPAQHWSARTLMDRNMSLWCGWAIIGPKHRAWFAGDTGYCSTFLEIGRKYGPFDLAAIPIGAYEPRWFMCHQHVNPEEAVQIHKDIGAKRSLGIHWGTFLLTSEPFLEPPSKLLEAIKEAELQGSEFVTVNHGETLYSRDDGSHSKE